MTLGTFMFQTNELVIGSHAGRMPALPGCSQGRIMTRKFAIFISTTLLASILLLSNSNVAAQTGAGRASRSTQSKATAAPEPPAVDGMFYETAQGRVPLPFTLTPASMTSARPENTVKKIGRAHV